MPDRKDRIVDGPHPFWFAACGIDTWARGSQYARNDTPWTAFTADDTRLVCTVWTDLVADIFDPEAGRVRRFVVLGGRSNQWKTGAIKRGLEAQQNLERARALRMPIYGFEVAATGEEQFAISRSIKHVFLDRAHNLMPVFGRDVDALKKRLDITNALAARWKSSDRDALDKGMLFELMPPTGDVPAAGYQPNSAANAVPGTQDYWAWRALPALVAHVHQQQDGQLHSLTYRQLGQHIGWMDKNGDPHARLGGVLGRVTEIIEEATADWPETHKPPYLTTVVVLKSAGIPDVGIRHRWPQFDQLSSEEQRAQVREEYDRILAYGDRWQEVLKAANLPPIAPDEATEPAEPAVTTGGWGGGESPEHKALKEFVLANPAMFGAPASCFAKDEYALLSQDCIDVFFRTDDVWIGVEVKSRRSDDADLERGIYQVVKYRAVLEAQALVHDVRPTITVYLAIQRPLPPRLQDAADQLSVRCFIIESAESAACTHRIQ